MASTVGAESPSRTDCGIGAVTPAPVSTSLAMRMMAAGVR
jgi:hypothetical protein